jgi:hypothetical protein
VRGLPEHISWTAASFIMHDRTLDQAYLALHDLSLIQEYRGAYESSIGGDNR